MFEIRPVFSFVRGVILTSDSIQSSLRIVGIQVPEGLAHHQTQFHLIVQLGSLRTQHGALTGDKDGRSRLQEEKRLLGLSAVELSDVIATDEEYQQWFMSHGFHQLFALRQLNSIPRENDGENARIVSANADDLSAIGPDGSCHSDELLRQIDSKE